MQLRKEYAEIYIPNGDSETNALTRTTHLGISAHQDDLEIMAYHGIIECFGKKDAGFMGVVVTNGSGSPRDDLYANYTDEQMQQVRKIEQKKAAFVGEYSALAMLGYSSSEIKDVSNKDVIEDIKTCILSAKPNTIYTHNLADKHDTHVATVLRVISALRNIPEQKRPQKLYGCEVWRGLDWLCDEDKVVFNVEAHENLALSLLGVFDSQICGGKRYDLATMGRRRANATYFASHGVDESNSIIFGLDLTPLIKNDNINPADYINEYIQRFAGEVSNRISKFA